MSRTTYYTATSLDGFVADPDDSLAWLFEQDTGDLDEGPFSFAAFTAGVGAVCLGRTTWDWIAAHDEAGWSDERPTWLFTHGPVEPAPRDTVHVVSGDVVPVHAAMVEAAGDAGRWVVGGGDLAADLARAGLLDEVVVSIAPVTLGAGRPLLGGAFDLRLLETGRHGSMLCARYDVVGPRPAAATARSASSTRSGSS